MLTEDIKNLSIALEALSRVPGIEARQTGKRVQLLLDIALTEKETPTPPPAYLTTPPDQDDEIPF